MLRLTLMGACLLLAGGVASASTTFTLYGTGFSDTGTALSAGGTDGNFTLESAPSPSNSCGSNCVSGITTPESPFVTDAGFPFGTDGWAPNGGTYNGVTITSKWDSPFANESTDSDPNSCPSSETSCSTPVGYIYQESFNLTGYNLSTVVITGEWSADNYGYIVVNGTEVTTGTDGIISNIDGQFEDFFDFVLNSSNTTFVSGTNTIDFYVFNNPNGTPDVTGLNVDIESDSASPAVPEPGSLGLLGLGLAGLYVAARKRRQA